MTVKSSKSAVQSGESETSTAQPLTAQNPLDSQIYAHDTPSRLDREELLRSSVESSAVPFSPDATPASLVSPHGSPDMQRIERNARIIESVLELGLVPPQTNHEALRGIDGGAANRKDAVVCCVLADPLEFEERPGCLTEELSLKIAENLLIGDGGGNSPVWISTERKFPDIVREINDAGVSAINDRLVNAALVIFRVEGRFALSPSEYHEVRILTQESADSFGVSEVGRDRFIAVLLPARTAGEIFPDGRHGITPVNDTVSLSGTPENNFEWMVQAVFHHTQQPIAVPNWLTAAQRAIADDLTRRPVTQESPAFFGAHMIRLHTEHDHTEHGR